MPAKIGLGLLEIGFLLEIDPAVANALIVELLIRGTGIPEPFPICLSFAY